MFKVVKGGKTPTKGSEFSACVDLYSREDIILSPSETALIPLGISLDLSKLWELKRSSFNTEKELDEWILKFKKTHYIQLMLRSSLSKKLIIANGVGIIDIDYKDEIMIRVHNPMSAFFALEMMHEKAMTIVSPEREIEKSSNQIIQDYSVSIKKGDKVAQIAILSHQTDLFGVVSTEKRVGGFGSTGKK